LRLLRVKNGRRGAIVKPLQDCDNKTTAEVFTLISQGL